MKMRMIVISCCLFQVPTVTAGEIVVPKVRLDAIGPEHWRNPAIETQLHREPGGWIADDIPMQKGESTHPKGMQPITPGRQAEPTGEYLPRADLKAGMTSADFAKIRTVRETKEDKE